jgi:hypothetical protein
MGVAESIRTGERPAADQEIVSTTRRDSESGDNQVVRRLLAVAILIVFASLNAIDGICCPDGCTHERESTLQQQGDHAGDGSCMLCLGGIDSAAAPALTPSGVPKTRVGRPPLMWHLDAPVNPPDHPPRA